jgi:Protein of unknown function (DUF1573)
MLRFNTNTLHNQVISSTSPSTFFFVGRNFGDILTIEDSGVSCSCTTVSFPRIIEKDEAFNVIVTIDKTNQFGVVNESAWIKVGGVTHNFIIKGKIV